MSLTALKKAKTHQTRLKNFFFPKNLHAPKLFLISPKNLNLFVNTATNYNFTEIDPLK
jgi:hypothetical protein